MSLCINPNCPKPENSDNLLFCTNCGSELLLEGRYRVTRQLGAGGFGRTYEVNDRNTPKVLKVLIKNDAKYVELFQREAEVLSKLNHPGIPQVEAEGYFTVFPRNSTEPLHCLVMERIEGMNLEEYLQQRGNRPINQKLALQWLTELATVLDVVHSQNFFHRDIKPSNIMLKPDGNLALAVATLPQVDCALRPDPSYFKGDNLPVERISWDEAVEFCARLSQKTGRTYRLPSESEWEYACRAGTITPFYFGKTITPYLANYDGNYTYSSGAKGMYYKKTTPVGSFQVPNAFGLYDMHGNVWEWCADPWHTHYQGAPSDGRVWSDNSDNRYRILRGGSWDNNPKFCRSACRNSFYPSDRYNLNIGVRVVCTST
ncbi:MAG: bifunctional serine/threonine-protein kinase/formylglycine-generating enzyme family protein [Cyanobacteriota bacterium]